MEIESIHNTLYKIEESLLNNEENRDYYNYIEDIINNESNDNIKKILINWKYKFDTYKSLNTNGIWVNATNNIYKDILYMLSIRELGKYELNTFPVTLHIIFDNTKEDSFININKLKQISEDLDNIFDKKYIHIKNNQYFTNDLYYFISKLNFNIIYEIESLDEIFGNKPLCHIYLKNIDMINDLVKKSKESSVNQLYITPSLKLSSDKNKFRKIMQDLSIKETTENFSILIDDYFPGQHLYLNDNKIYILSSSYSFNPIIASDPDSSAKNIKMELIKANYLNDKCYNCDEKILCMLGISDVDCESKIF